MGNVLYTGRVELDSGVLNVRTQPGGEVIGTIAGGEEVGVLGENGDWLEIVHGEGTAYAAKKYIRFVKAQQDARLIIEDDAGNVFIPVGGFAARIVSGAID